MQSFKMLHQQPSKNYVNSLAWLITIVIWIHRSDILSPLTKLVSKTVKWLWTDEQQNAFDMMKKLLSREALLSYPDSQNLLMFTQMQVIIN
jgi:hypothetical protein